MQPTAPTAKPRIPAKNSPHYAPPTPSIHPSQSGTIDVEADLANVRAEDLAFNRAKESRPKTKFNDGQNIDFSAHMARFDRVTDIRGMDARGKVMELGHWFEGPSNDIIEALATGRDAEATYTKIRAKLERFYGKKTDAINHLVDKVLAGKPVSKMDGNAHTRFLAQLYQIDVAADESGDITESRKRDWTMRLLQNRVNYMREPFLEEESVRADEGKDEYTFTDFIARIERRVQVLTYMDKPPTTARIAVVDTNLTKDSHINPTETSTCNFCQGSHPAAECSTYTRLTPDARAEKIREKRLCFRCLSNKHPTRDCQITPKCDMCSWSHMTSLHGQTPNLRTNPRQYASTVTAPTAATQTTQVPDPSTLPIDAANFIQGAAAHAAENPARSS